MAKYEFIITCEREEGVIQSLWSNDRIFDQAIDTPPRFFILTCMPYVNDQTNNWELEILAYVRVEARDVDILNGLILPCLIV